MGFKPFANLKAQLAAKRKHEQATPPKKTQATSEISCEPASVDKDEESQEVSFTDIVADVEPLKHNKIIAPTENRLSGVKIFKEDDCQAKETFDKLIQQGDGFDVAQTSEYMDGSGYNIHPEISRRLHKGAFAIQAHLDLHGMNRHEAEEIFDEFMQASFFSGKRAVLIIHGRGLSSPGRPVLKTKVFEWLTRGPWRKWVIAFSSARPVDGGPGATYVLLRKNPATKRARRGNKVKGKHQFSP